MSGLIIKNQGMDLVFSQAKCLRQEKKAKVSSELWQTETYLGWALVEDGLLKYTEKDADGVNEILAHSILFAHSFAKDVLVVGAADGGLIRYILQHTSVRKVDWVISHQPSFEIAQEYFHIASLKQDKRVNVIQSAPLDYLRSNNDLYDVAFSDHALHGSHQLERTHDYYQALSNHMKVTGILLFTSGFWVADYHAILNQKKMVQEHFPQCGISGLSVPSQMGGVQTWIWAANKDLSTVDMPLLHAKMEMSAFEAAQYSMARHQAFFNPLIED